MGNSFLDTSLVDKALKFAVDAHHNQERRGKGTPYVLHVLEAVSIVETLTRDPELLAAAALHDTIEDTDVTAKDIEREFGKRVRALVETDTALVPEGKTEEETWKARKQEAMDSIKASDREAQIVALGDKLSNMRAIYRDYMDIGDELWNRFHEKRRSEHEWHYRGLAASFDKVEDTHAYKEFVHLINLVFSGEK